MEMGKGKRERRGIEEGRGVEDGRGKERVGRVIGVIGIVVWGLFFGLIDVGLYLGKN